MTTNVNKEQDAKIAEQAEVLEAQQAKIAELEEKLADMEAKKAESGMAGINPEMPAPKYTEAQLNEYVSVNLFKDDDKYKDDVIVSVNGETCIIKRGVDVKVKLKFKRALDISKAQDMRTADLISKEESDFAEKLEQLN